MRAPSHRVAVLAAALAVGCKGAEDDLEPARMPKPVAFAGKVDPSYAGAWHSQDGNSKLDLGKDGSARIEAVSTSVKGRSVSRVVGLWLVSKGDLLLRYPEKAGGETTVKYAARLSGDSLTLLHGTLKTFYSRKRRP